MWRRYLTSGGLVFLLGATCLWALGLNVAPDALTRATQGYNLYEGDLAYLTDGLYPDSEENSPVFAWPNKGNLVFEFDQIRPIERMRLCVGGDGGAYQVIAYQGARFGANGQTDAALGSAVADLANFDFATDTWVELVFPAGTEADYIELATEGGATFYEIEILAPLSQDTQVFAPTWGMLKAMPWRNLKDF